MTRTVLFLCTGNYYRSRFAEILFNATAARRGLPWCAESRGLALELGRRQRRPALAARGRAADPARHPLRRATCACRGRSRRATCARADLVIALEGRRTPPPAAERHADWAERVEYWDVHDVYDLPAEEALPAIERSVGS